MKQKKILIYLLIISMIVIAFLPCQAIFSKAEETNSEYSLEAILYDTNQYSGGTGTPLTSEGAQVDNWQYNTSKYLQIDPNVPADGATYVVTVKLPQEFYIVGSELVTPSGYQKVEFTKNESISVNTDSTYDLNPYSGTAEYIMNYMGISGTIQIELRYDTTLWDKQPGSSLTSDGVKPIEVILSKIDDTNTKTELSNLSINKVTAGTETSYSGSVAVSSTNVYSDKTITFSASYNSQIERMYMYYSKMTLTAKMPYYTDSSGNKYYLPLDTSTITFPTLKNAKYNIDTSTLLTDGIITVDFENVYFTNGTLITMTLGPLNEELQEIEQNTFTFTGGNITVTAESKNGVSGINLFSMNTSNIKYLKEIEEDVKLTYASKSATITERPSDAVSEFGGFYLENVGTGDSSEKTIYIEFDDQNTNLIKITTINTFADTLQEYIDITYTLVDENGNRVYLDGDGNEVEEGTNGATGEWIYSIKNKYYNKTSIDNMSNMFTRSMLPESHQKYYFKTVEYTLNSINAGRKLYKRSANAALDGTGNFFGYVSPDAIDGEKTTSKITVKSSNADIADLTKTSTTTLELSSRPTYQINNLKMSESSIEAGESVNITGTLEGVTYPYGNSMWLKGIRLALILPKDVTVNEQSITMTTSKKVQITDFEIITQDTGDGNVLWIIKLPSDIYFGYASESLGMLESGSFINFNLQLDTAYTMNNSTLFSGDIIFAAGYKQENSGAGTYIYTAKTDTYDLNENGLTTDKIAGAKNDTAPSCQIVAQVATLDIIDSVSIDRQGSITQEGASQSILMPTDIVNYNLDISCFSGGSAEGFSYYMPIPKTTSTIDGFLIEGTEGNLFDFATIGPVTLTGNDIFLIQYAFEPCLSYEEVQNFDTWYSQTDIEDDSTLNWEDVTMVKLTLKGESIENGSSTRITMQMKYAGDSYETKAGRTNTWHSGGFYRHINNDRETAGNFATTGVTVDLKYSQELEELEEITLTAAKNRTPQIEGNVNTKTIEKTKFPQFEKTHTFSITSVETYNVELQTKEYMEANVDMPGIDANKMFAITVKMSGQTEKDILADAQTNPVEIGKTSENSAPEFTFSIYNADALSDNSQIRYIVVTLTSDNGVTIKQKININRELTMATTPKSAIVAGKRYLTFDDTTTQVTISQDSAFTTQFVLEYIPDNYKDPKLTFSNNLPIGTNIILANLTDTEEPKYWYYNIKTELSEIKLVEFIAMGTTDTKNFVETTGADIIQEKLLVIVDFSQCDTEYISEGNYTIKITYTGEQSGIEDFFAELEFVTKTKKYISLQNDETVTMGNEFSIGYSIEETEGADSKYEGRKLSLIMTAPSNMPTDTSLMVGDITYNLNANKQFIVPLGDMQKQSDILLMTINSNMLPRSGEEYEFDVQLWVSATANANAPLLGENVGSGKIFVTAIPKLTPALQVIKMEKRMIHKSELNENLVAEYQYIPADNCYVTVELQQKIGTAYQKITDKLNQVNNTTNHTMGVFQVEATQGTNQIIFKLASTTQPDTYRIVFKVYDENGVQLLQVPYNFLLIE